MVHGQIPLLGDATWGTPRQRRVRKDLQEQRDLILTLFYFDFHIFELRKLESIHMYPPWFRPTVLADNLHLCTLGSQAQTEPLRRSVRTAPAPGRKPSVTAEDSRT